MKTAKSAPKILVVDDEPEICELFASPLVDLGYSVVTAPGVSEGIEKLKTEGPFDLIVTDLKTPTGEGRELLIEVRKTNATTPVVFVTAYASDVETGLLAEGATLVLPKPLRLSLFTSEIEALLAPMRSPTSS